MKTHTSPDHSSSFMEGTTPPTPGEMRAFHMVQVQGGSGWKTYALNVENIEQAYIALQILAYYDLMLGNLIIANAQGVVIWDEDKQKWLDWEDANGRSFDELRNEVEQGGPNA